MNLYELICLFLLKAPSQFDSSLVVNQLRYSGMLETVKIRKAGFPVRRQFEEFIKRYKAIILKEDLSKEAAQLCSLLLIRFDDKKVKWRMGKSKVFMKENLESQLETELKKELGVLASTIKACIKGFIVR